MKIPVVLLITFFLTSCSSSPKRGEKIKELTYPLGVKQYVWEDAARPDAYYGGNRLINTQVWYPGAKKSREESPAPYYFRIEEAYEKLDNWTEEDYQLVRAVPTISSFHKKMDGASAQFPLIIFSPSLGGNLSQYTYYAEHLAQQGYIVMGVNHLYESEYVLDLKGNTRPVNITFHDSLKTLKIPEQITADQYRAVKGLRQKVLGEDLIFALDQILREPFFKDRIDVSRVGALGHSIGGAAAVYASMLDDRIKAVVNIDGTPPSVALEKGISAPFLFIEDLTDYENHPGYAKLHTRRNDFCEKNISDSWRVLLAGTSHNSFLDINYFLANDDKGKLQAQKVLDQTFGYMESFFSAYLNARSLDLTSVKTDSVEIFRF